MKANHMPDVKVLAEVAFEAYNENAGGKTYDGKDIPPYSSVGSQVQSNWEAAVRSVLDEITYLDSQGV